MYLYLHFDVCNIGTRLWRRGIILSFAHYAKKLFSYLFGEFSLDSEDLIQNVPGQQLRRPFELGPLDALLSHH